MYGKTAPITLSAHLHGLHVLTFFALHSIRMFAYDTQALDKAQTNSLIYREGSINLIGKVQMLSTQI